LASATPVMAGRILNNIEPSSPFLTANHDLKQGTTPIMQKV